MDEQTQRGGEVWKPVPDTEGRYEASDRGRVRSLVVGCRHGSIARHKPLVMSPFNNKPGGTGYWVVNLRVGGRVKCRCVSELVLTAFVGPRPSPMHDAAHANGDRHDNAFQNLVWATKKENAAHKRLHGTHRRRPRGGSAGREGAESRGGGGGAVSPRHTTAGDRNGGAGRRRRGDAAGTPAKRYGALTASRSRGLVTVTDGLFITCT